MQVAFQHPNQGNVLVNKNSSGKAKENMLISHGYNTFFEQNISKRHIAVSANGPITATLREIIIAYSPLACILIPTYSGNLELL